MVCLSDKGGMIIDNKKNSVIILYRRIGHTTYKVNIHFSDTAAETLDDKILHLIQREILTNGVEIPQTSQPPEGSPL